MNEVTIQLEYPLRLNDQEVRELTLKRPTLGNFAACQGLTGFEESIKLISLVSGVAPLLIKQMDLIDLRKCSDFFDSLTKKADESDL